MMKTENNYLLVDSGFSSRITLPDKLQQECPPGDYVFFIEPRDDFNDEFVDRTVRLALTSTRALVPKNTCTFDDSSALQNLGHAFEHLVIIDLFRRLELKTTDYKDVGVGRTVTGNNLEGNPRVFFWVRENLAPNEEIFQSIDNVMNLISSGN